MTRRRIAIALLLAIAPVILTAQSPGSLGTDGRGLAEALRLGNAGQTAAARLTIDSMIKITPPDASDFADLLFARATFALNALDAGLDYQRIINDFPASEKRKESLLRVAQRALLTGESAKALDYLGIRSSEYADDASLAVTDYWKARAHFDSHDVRAACDALRDGKLHAKNSGAGSLAELEALSSASCAMTPSASTTVADSQPVKIATTTPKVKTDISAAARSFRGAGLRVRQTCGCRRRVGAASQERS
jgi:hypothetical protein